LTGGKGCRPAKRRVRNPPSVGVDKRKGGGGTQGGSQKSKTPASNRHQKSPEMRKK